MNKRITLLALVLALSGFAPLATAGGNGLVDELARISDLSPRQVQMVLGVRTAHAAYLTSYERVKRQLIRAIGNERYQQLARREAVRSLQPETVAVVAAAD